MSFDFLILKSSNLFILSMTSYSVCLTTVFLMPHRAFILSVISLAAHLNKYSISVTSDISPLDTSKLPSYLPLPVQPPTIILSVATVQKKLFSLGTFKAPGAEWWDTNPHPEKIGPWVNRTSSHLKITLQCSPSQVKLGHFTTKLIFTVLPSSQCFLLQFC